MPRSGRSQPNRSSGGIHPAIIIRNKLATTPGVRVPPTLVLYSDTSFTTTTTPKSTGASFSWQAGDIFLVIGGTSDQNTSINVPTVAGLTFAPATPLTVASSCWANSWTATAGASGSGVISATTAGVGNFWGISVWQFRGSDGFGNRTGQDSVAATESLTRSLSNSYVCQGLFDWAAIAPAGHGWTPAGQVERQANTVGSQYTFYIADWGDQGNAGITSYGITGITPTQNFSSIAVEVLGTTAVTGIPNNPARRDTQLTVYLRRGRQTSPVPAQVVVTSPSYVASPARRDTQLALYLRRGRQTSPVPAQVVTPPSYVASPARRDTQLALFVRRTKVVVPVDASPFALTVVRRNSRSFVYVRHGRGTVSVPVSDLPVPVRRPTARWWKPRSGRISTPVPSQVAVTPPTYVLTAARQAGRGKVAWQRRGRATWVTPTQIAAAPPAYVLTPARQSGRRWAALRHGRVTWVVPTQTAAQPPVWVPSTVRRPTRLALLAKRSRTGVVLGGHGHAPSSIQRRDTQLILYVRRVRPSQPVIAQPAPINPSWLPNLVRRARLWFTGRRGRNAQGPLSIPVIGNPATFASDSAAPRFLTGDTATSLASDSNSTGAVALNSGSGSATVFIDRDSGTEWRSGP